MTLRTFIEQVEAINGNYLKKLAILSVRQVIHFLRPQLVRLWSKILRAYPSPPYQLSLNVAYHRINIVPEDLRTAIVERTVRAGGQEQPPVHLSPGVYVAQCAWSWFVDPPRRITRRIREARAEQA